MQGMNGKKAGMLLIFMLFAGAFACLEQGYAAVVEQKEHYDKLPAFLETGVDPNLLLLIDNSASMNDPAYRDLSAGSGSCYDDAYEPTKSYAGYFDSSPDTWYNYNFTDERFESISMTGACTSSAAYAHSDLCLILDSSDNVTWVRATGRFWNWLLSSKFDVEKEILTGGKYDSGNNRLIMESRGCLEERFIKQVPVSKSGVDYYATFAVRPPTSTEKTADQSGGVNSVSNTRLEIFKPTTSGFNAGLCNDATDYWATPGANLGTLKDKTTDCLRGSTSGSITGLTASQTAFNHILQECWYYKSNGEFQPGAGTVTSLKNDCEAVYGTLGGDYTAPEDLRASEVCAGQYAPSASNRWGYGYVGQCWEPDYSNPLIVDSCVAGDPTTQMTAIDDGLGNYFYCDTASGARQQCNKKPNPSNGSCSPGGWSTRLVTDPAGSTINSVDWTDDDSDSGYLCVESALQAYCKNLDDVTVIDPDVSDPLGTAWAIPAVLLDAAVVTQLGEPLTALKGLLANTTSGGAAKSPPIGLVQEFKYNLRMGAMVFNPGAGTDDECMPVLRSDGTYRASLYDCLYDKGSYITASSTTLDPSQRDGGRIISYIDDEDHGYNDYLVNVLNNIEATAWTPTAEAFFNAVGYFTQDNGGTASDTTDDLRINGVDDFIWDHDATDLGVNAWDDGVLYQPGDRVTFQNKLYFTRNGGTSTAGASGMGEDKGVDWTPYDPVQAGCQDNNILLISDGASTADLFDRMITAAGTSGETNDTGTDGECTTSAGDNALYGSTWLDDLTYYASQSGNTTLYPSGYQQVDGRDKQPVKTYVVAAGTLESTDTTECGARTQLTNAADNSGTTLYESDDPAQLKANLRAVFEAIGGEVSSGSAASVISHSRSGDGAIYQAIFYPKQIDQYVNEVDWVGDVHALWLDEYGNIREDCGATDCSGDGDRILNPETDYIIQFYTDEDGSARARRFLDADGNGSFTDSAGCSDDSYTTQTDCEANGGTWTASDQVADNIQLKDLNYLWSGAEWLAGASTAQRTYGSTLQARYVFTMLPDTSDDPKMIPFTPAAVKDALTAIGKSYPAYFNAVDDTEANAIINYIRGDDQSYRSRQLDWDGDGSTETVKLGDIIHSTPTLVGAPAENYDVVYGDPTYRAFRKKYQNRRSVIYAGGNDGGLHAFNAGYYDRHAKKFESAADSSLIQYDLGAELWMYVPKNVFPHLRWLTEDDYGEAHNYYVDGKPYIFDAKIFTDDSSGANIHPGGWGTVLVVGMRYGGGKITVSSGDIMRSSYSILDITDPEKPPVVLAEFTHDTLGYTTGSPTAIPMLRCDKNTIDGLGNCNTNQWPMDWYLAFGSGPHSILAAPAGPDAGMQGLSDQEAGLYILKLGGVGAAVGSGQVVASSTPTFLNPPELVGGQTLSPGVCSDPAFTNETACTDHIDTWTAAHCSKEGYATEGACIAIPEVWTPGECSNGDYSNQTDCENAREIWTAGVCSNDDYSDEASCVAAPEKWTWTVGSCSDSTYGTQASCLAATEKWTGDECAVTGWSQSSCEGATWNGTYTGGVCYIPSSNWQVYYTIEECRNFYSNTTWIDAFCSDPTYTDEANCTAASANETWNWTDGTCSNPAYNSDQAGCLAANATWTAEFCSNNSYDNQTECEDAPEVWTPGFCSNDDYSNEEDCIAARETWTPDTCSDSRWSTEDLCTNPQETWTTTNRGNSFYGDFIAVDYDLSFQVESLYFGSVYNAVSGGHDAHKGALHRLVINDDPDPTHWYLNTFYDVHSPVTAAPSVATDGSRAWIYFGTGRLFSAKEDKAILATTPPTQFLGLKENYNSDGEMDLSSLNGGNLIDVTDVWVVDDGIGTLHTKDDAPIPTTTGTLDSTTDTFFELNDDISLLEAGVDKYHGWKIELDNGERVIGQPAILGDIVTFTSYIPSSDPCVPDGISYLWAPYFRTGTAYYKSVIGTRLVGSETEVLRKTGLGPGLSTTPNIYTGAGDGSKAFVQSSTGAITSIEQTNPGVVKSGMRGWRELGSNSGSCN